MRRIIQDEEVMAMLARKGKRYSMAALKVELITEFGKFSQVGCRGGQEVLDIDGMAKYLTQANRTA